MEEISRLNQLLARDTLSPSDSNSEKIQEFIHFLTNHWGANRPIRYRENMDIIYRKVGMEYFFVSTPCIRCNDENSYFFLFGLIIVNKLLC